MWGSAQISENEVLFAVGSKAYPAEPHYFVIDSDYCLFFVNDMHKKEVYKQCADKNEIISEIINLLKEWFPAKKI